MVEHNGVLRSSSSQSKNPTQRRVFTLVEVMGVYSTRHFDLNRLREAR